MSRSLSTKQDSSTSKPFSLGIITKVDSIANDDKFLEDYVYVDGDIPHAEYQPVMQRRDSFLDYLC